MNKRFDGLRGFLSWDFGLMFAGMFPLVGFVVWDRRTAFAPIARTTKELEQRDDKIITTLREYAREDPKLLEIMKRMWIL